MHDKGEKHWKKLSLTAGLRDIVNKELCICIVFREKKQLNREKRGVGVWYQKEAGEEGQGCRAAVV